MMMTMMMMMMIIIIIIIIIIIMLKDAQTAVDLKLHCILLTGRGQRSAKTVLNVSVVH